MLFYKALSQVMKLAGDSTKGRKPRARPASKRHLLREQTSRLEQVQKDLDSVDEGFKDGHLDLHDLTTE
jgi:hypothetical protein